MSRILVIKLAALGDFVQAIGPMQRIRAAHPDAELDLLTTPPYASLGAATGFYERIFTDGRPKSPVTLFRMLQRLRKARYDRVYDLQTSDRSCSYFQALRPHPPEWSGIAPGCSHPHRNAERDRMHTLERQAEQLQDAGVWPDAPTAPGSAPPPDLGFMLARATPEQRPQHFGLREPYALLIPGASAQRPGKRWPVDRYAALATALAGRGLQPVAVGGPGESLLGRTIAEACDGARDLTGQTDYAQLAGLGARAALAVGNDTGPTHLIAATGAPTLTLFGGDSDPALCAPRGRRAVALAAPHLEQLDVQSVVRSAVDLLASS